MGIRGREGLDQMQVYLHCGAQSGNIAGIGGYFRLEENDVHTCLQPSRTPVYGPEADRAGVRSIRA